MNDKRTRTHRPALSRWLPAAIACLCAVLVALALGCATSGTPSSVGASDRKTLRTSDIEVSSSSSRVAAEASVSAETTPPETEAEPALATLLNPQLEALANASGMQVCTVVTDLRTGATAGYQSNEQMVSASMIKLVIAYAFLEQAVANGGYSLDGMYTLQPGDIVGGTGTLGSLGAGATVSYREILTKMISVSDNTGTNILIDAVGMDAVNATARNLGLTATQLNRHMMDFNGTENYTSASDVAKLLEKAYNGTFVNAEGSALVMQALEAQQDIGGLLNGLPAGTVFAHKTGTLTTVRHDGGIVEGERPFVVVVLCGGAGFYEGGALSTMAQIASAAYEAVAA